MKFGFDWPSSFGEEVWTDDGYTLLYYKLTNEPKGSGELKMKSLSIGQYFPHYNAPVICNHCPPHVRGIAGTTTFNP